MCSPELQKGEHPILCKPQDLVGNTLLHMDALFAGESTGRIGKAAALIYARRVPIQLLSMAIEKRLSRVGGVALGRSVPVADDRGSYQALLR